jgi:hypothetical protein
VRVRGQAAAQAPLESQDVHPGITAGGELDRLLGGVEKRGRPIGNVSGHTISDRGAQVGQRAPQIGAGRTFRPVGPQQPGQLLAAMGPIGFDGQIGQEGPDLVRLKACDRFAIQRYLERAKETDQQTGHDTPSLLKFHIFLTLSRRLAHARMVDCEVQRTCCAHFRRFLRPAWVAIQLNSTRQSALHLDRPEWLQKVYEKEAGNANSREHSDDANLSGLF